MGTVLSKNLDTIGVKVGGDAGIQFDVDRTKAVVKGWFDELFRYVCVCGYLCSRCKEVVQ